MSEIIVILCLLVFIWAISVANTIRKTFDIVMENNRLLSEIRNTQFNDGRQFGIIRGKLEKLEKMVKKNGKQSNN